MSKEEKREEKKENQKDFKVKNEGGMELELSVLSPSIKQRGEAQIEFNKTFNKALRSGGLLRQSINKYMEDQGLWDEKREEKYKGLIKGINEGEKKIKKGGIKLSEGKGAALDMQEKRGELQTLLMERNSLDVHSVEGQAQQSEFEHLLYSCLVYTESRESYYSSKEEFEKEKNGGVAQEASVHLMALVYGSTEDFTKGLPENKFLKKWGFSDDKMRLIDSEGRLVNQEGKLVNEEGRFVNEEGGFVDIEGNSLDEDGNYAFETQPFVDEEGEEIEEEEKKEESKQKEKEPETVPEEDQPEG